MPVKITIIGTGQVGASIGLALGKHKDMFLRVGHDKDLKIANRAKALGALDRVDFNLPSSVHEAAIVILAIPLDQIKETLKYIADELQEDAVIMDTAPLKGETLQWFAELLPGNRHYIGLTPMPNPVYLNAPGAGVESAHADFFENGMMAIVTPPEVPAEAIKLAADLSTLMGAEHIFIDPTELDSMLSATYLLPQLLSAALVNTTTGQPGWKDARKLTGLPFSLASGAVAAPGEASSLAEQAISAREHLLRRVDMLVDYLYILRQQIEAGDAEHLQQELERATLERQKWLKERTAAHWSARETASSVELPTARETFTRMFTFGGGKKPKPRDKNN